MGKSNLENIHMFSINFFSFSFSFLSFPSFLPPSPYLLPLSLSSFFFSPNDIFPLSLERERERKRNIDTREKHWMIASHMCWDWGWNSQPRYVPWSGIKYATFQLWDNAPTNCEPCWPGLCLFCLIVFINYSWHSILFCIGVGYTASGWTIIHFTKCFPQDSHYSSGPRHSYYNIIDYIPCAVLHIPVTVW